MGLRAALLLLGALVRDLNELARLPTSTLALLPLPPGAGHHPGQPDQRHRHRHLTAPVPRELWGVGGARWVVDGAWWVVRGGWWAVLLQIPACRNLHGLMDFRLTIRGGVRRRHLVRSVGYVRHV